MMRKTPEGVFFHVFTIIYVFDIINGYEILSGDLYMKNIFFDFGRTIVEHPEDGAGLRIVKSFGIENEADAALVRDVLFSIGKYAGLMDEGAMTRDEYKEKLCQDLPEHLHTVALRAADYNIGMLPMIDGMEALLKKLKNDGFNLYITSNMDEYHAKQMYSLELAKYFDGMIFSAEIKVGKPHREFFDAACERFGVKAEDCLFIDDLADNVSAAEKCGIKGFVFKGNAKDAEMFIYENNGIGDK